MPKRIVYTRHPECAHNVDYESALRKGIVNRDSPLTALGELQCKITAAYLRHEFPVINAVFCSTYLRTRLMPIVAGFESMLRVSALLDERNMGVWHTHPRADVLQMHPGEEERHKAAGYYAYEASGGESCIGVERRHTELLTSGVLGGSDDTVYISGHGIAGRCFRRVLTGASVADWHSWEGLKNGSVTVYERQGSVYVCTSYNLVPWEGMIDPALLKRKSVEA